LNSPNRPCPRSTLETSSSFIRWDDSLQQVSHQVRLTNNFSHKINNDEFGISISMLGSAISKLSCLSTHELSSDFFSVHIATHSPCKIKSLVCFCFVEWTEFSSLPIHILPQIQGLHVITCRFPASTPVISLYTVF